MERISIPVGAETVPAMVMRGSRPSGPAVLMMPAAFGLAADVLEQITQLAEQASLVVALDLFWRDGRGAIGYGDTASVMARIRELNQERALAELLAVCRWTKQQDVGNGRLLGLGVCLGGPFVFLAAQRGCLDAVVTWHGSRLDSFLAEAAAMRCPMALHFGERDRIAPLDAVERIKAAFKNHDDVEITVHSGADHGFSHPLGPTYDEAAYRAGFESVRALLARLSV